MIHALESSFAFALCSLRLRLEVFVMPLIYYGEPRKQDRSMYEVALYNTPLPSLRLVLLLCTLFRVVSLAKAGADMGQHKKASYTPTRLVNRRYLT